MTGNESSKNPKLVAHGKRPANLDHLAAMRERLDENRKSATTCRRGHPWTPESTYTRPNGARSCRTCRNEQEKRAQAKQFIDAMRGA